MFLEIADDSHLLVFLHILNIAGINSHVIHTVKQEETLDCRKFLKN